jgi:hypothetical protein
MFKCSKTADSGNYWLPFGLYCRLPSEVASINQWPFPQFSNSDNLGPRIQPPQVIRLARNDGVSPLSGKDHHRSFNRIRQVGGGAEFSTRTGKVLVEGNNFHFLAPQEPRQRHLKSSIAPSLSHDTRGHSKRPALSQRPLQQSDHALVTASQGD